MCDKLYSKRHFKRLVKKKKDSYDNIKIKNKGHNDENVCKINNYGDKFPIVRSEKENASPVEKTNVNEINNYGDNFPIVRSENENATPVKKTIAEKMAVWAIKNRVTRNTCNEVLEILKDTNLDIPRSKKSLLAKYQPMGISVVEMAPGEYFHYGLQKALQIEVKYIDLQGDTLLLDIFCDGLPLFKSSAKSLWPILGAISNCQISTPFLIGTYIGPSKPPDVEKYLKEFIEEYTLLKNNGLLIGDKWFKPEIRVIICDAPAKAFLTGTVGHTCSYGCSKCEQKAIRINKRLAYSLTVGNLRTDQAFKDRKSKNFHQLKFHMNAHPLENCDVKMVSQFPLDVMHLFDLGVVKKILTLIWNRKHLKRSRNLPDKILLDQKVKQIAKATPKEFGRKCRSFDELPRWKATEFRQVVLYTGFILLKDVIDSELYEHFMLLMTAYRFISLPENEKNLKCVQDLLVAFVEDFSKLYGEDRVSYNVHNLLHISECVKNFGCVDTFSSYKFENFLQTLKKDCRKGSKIAQQLNNRITEKSLIPREKKKNGPLGKKWQNIYPKFQCGDYFLSNKPPNCYCLTKDFEIVKVDGFMEDSEKQFVVGKYFNDVTSSFHFPVDSQSALGIVKASTLTEIEQKLDVNKIYCKLFVIAEEEHFHFVPILHHCI